MFTEVRAMTQSINTLEKSAFRSFWDDGLLDLMVGLVILVVGLSWWQDVAVFGAIFPAVCASMWYPLRKRLIEPHMGYVEFSGQRELKVRSFRHGLIAFFAGTTVLGMVIFALWQSHKLPQPTEWIAGFPLVLVAIPAVFFALFTNCRRFLVYALLLLVAAIEVILLRLEPHVGLIGSGAVITLSGLVQLVRFLARYPAERP